MALAPVYDRLSRILGQIAGLIMLSGSSLEAGRISSHLASVKDQLAEAREAFAGLSSPNRLARSFAAAGSAIPALDALAAGLAKRPAGTLRDDAEFGAALDRIAAIRAALHAASAPGLGIGVVDFTSACCAWSR